MKEEKYTIEDVFLYGLVVCGIMFVLPFYYIEDRKHWTLILLKVCAMVPILFMFVTVCQAAWGALLSALDDSTDDDIAEEMNYDSDNLLLLLSVSAFIVFALGVFASSGWMWTDNAFLTFAGRVAVSLSWIVALVLSMLGPEIEEWCEQKEVEST